MPMLWKIFKIYRILSALCLLQKTVSKRHTLKCLASYLGTHLTFFTQNGSQNIYYLIAIGKIRALHLLNKAVKVTEIIKISVCKKLGR